MLGYQQLVEAQVKGEAQLSKLTGDERTIMQGYADSAADGLLQLGARQKASVNDIVLNAFRNGVALGTQIAIVNGIVERRFK